MIEAPHYSATGTKKKAVVLPALLFDGTVNEHALHRAVVTLLANQRQGTHDTKTRRWVVGGNQKPWRQKGTGRARQGSTRAPHWRHGGIVFGPHPRDYRLGIPKKVRQLAKKSALNARAREEALFVVDSLEYEKPKTKTLAELLGQGLGLRLLVLERVDHEQGLLARPRVQRGFLRELAHLLRNAQPVVAGMGPEHDPAVPPVRRAGRALPRPAGALLAPRLLVAARDFAPGFGVARPLELVREEGDHGAVQGVLVHRAVEQRGRQAHRFLLRAGGGVVRRFNHDGSALPVCAP